MSIEKVARDLWGRNIQSTEGLTESAKKKLKELFGEDAYSKVDTVLKEKWDQWTKEMLDFFEQY